jgi:hypothetical protein
MSGLDEQFDGICSCVKGNKGKENYQYWIIKDYEGRRIGFFNPLPFLKKHARKDMLNTTKFYKKNDILEDKEKYLKRIGILTCILCNYKIRQQHIYFDIILRKIRVFINSSTFLELNIQ